MNKLLKISIVIIFSLCFGIVKGYAGTSLHERVYLQTDKELYLAGELLWLKLYTTDIEGKLSSLSKIGYVELINDSIPEVQVKLDIANGTGTGWMELPAVLSTGNYRLVAYTRHMRNEGENVFFEKNIGIINPYHYARQTKKQDGGTTATAPPAVTTSNSIHLSIDKPHYGKRNKGELYITGLPAEGLSLTVSIAGTEPGMYHNTNNGIVSWKNNLKETASPGMDIRFLPEYEGIIIEGRLTNIETEGQPSSGNIISLLSFPGENIHLSSGKQDKDGKITFFTQQNTGKKEISTTAIDPFGKHYRIDIESPYTNHAPKQLPPIIIDNSWIDYLKNRSLGLQVVNTFTADSLSAIKNIAPPTYLTPHRSYILDNYTRFPVMEELFVEFILTARIRRVNGKRTFFAMTENLGAYTSGNTLVLLDNIPVTDHELMCDYNPLLIKKIDVYFGRHIWGGQPFDGILHFSSYKNDYPSITFPATTQLFDYEGTQPYRYFYAPSYETEAETTARMPDFRHTLLWEPSLQSNKQQELSIPFTTSDIPGKYKITVEGISKEGTIIHATYQFEVKEE